MSNDIEPIIRRCSGKLLQELEGFMSDVDATPATPPPLAAKREQRRNSPAGDYSAAALEVGSSDAPEDLSAESYELPNPPDVTLRGKYQQQSKKMIKHVCCDICKGSSNAMLFLQLW